MPAKKGTIYDFSGDAVKTYTRAGEYIVLFQERSISRMAFEGPPTVFAWADVSKKKDDR